MTASFEQTISHYRPRIDRLMWAAVMPLILLCLAFGFNGSWPLAVAVLGVSVPIAWGIMRWQPGTFLSGATIATLSMICSALLIEQTGGLLEAHFSIFIMLSALVLYCDWRVIAVGAGVIAVHHAVFTCLQYAGVSRLYTDIAPADADIRRLSIYLAAHVGAIGGHALVLVFLTQFLREVAADRLDIAGLAKRAEGAAQGSGSARTEASAIERQDPVS